MREQIDVAIPTCGRTVSLAITLATLLGQTYPHFRILISDQGGDESRKVTPELAALFRVFEAHGNQVIVAHHPPRHGMAEQRDFLLKMVSARKVLFLDDDLVLEREVLERLVGCLDEEECGFVGSAVIGLSYLHDVRPEEQTIEFWEGRVLPERVAPGQPCWERYKLHNAANIYHVQEKLKLLNGRTLRYKVAWVGGCVLYDTDKLRSTGGFSFWEDLPPNHCGEDVLAQLRVMARYGGCGLVPSGVYHQEVPTTISDRSNNAPELLPVCLQTKEAHEA